ncbi:ABC transporter ATP-binding protein [Deinococcus aerophilus]|nr:ABC transporter ATP-binding protein [Deinococcus aerophilus]
MVFRGTGGDTVALQDANLDIAHGEFVSLIGPSGCGKTTLLRLMADLITPTSGELLVGGQTPAQARQARAYGYVFQAPALLEWRTVLNNVLLPLDVMNTPKAQRQDRAHEMLRLVGLEGFAGRYPWQLSGGMQQRVSIARALAFDPGLLLMDEPFGALDEITREHLNGELLRLWQETGKTVVFVTHGIGEAVFLSTRVVVMTARPGKIEGVVDIDLPYPRNLETRETPRFFELATQVRELLRRGHGFDGAG